jgi:hypothetical protein
LRRLQYDAPSQAVKNLITNPELVADVSDKLLYKNVVTNPSFETAGSIFDLWVNNVMNPSFRATNGNTETRRNLALNPSMELTSGTPTVRTNLVTHPSFELTSGTSTLRTNICTNPGMEDAGSSVAVRTNLTTNPGFEADNGTVTVRSNSVNNPSLAVNATGWSTYGGGATHPSLVTSRAAASWSSSGYAWKVEGTASSAPYMAELGVGDFPIGGGVPISVSINVIASGTRRARIRLRFSGGAGGDHWSPDFWLNSTAPTRMTYTTTAPTGATSVSFNVKEGSGAADNFLAGDWIAGSMAMVEVNSLVSGAYFDGSTPNTNLITNSDFEVDGSGWWANTGSPTVTVSSEQAFIGTKSLKAVTTLATADNAVVRTVSGLKAGQTYTLSYYVYSMDARTNCYFDIAATNYSSPTQGARSVPAQTWTRVSATFTISPNMTGDTHFYLHHAGGPSTVGTVVYIDAVLLEQTSLLNPYFGSGEYTYAWAATAHASTSYERATGVANILTTLSGNGGATSKVYQTPIGRSGKGLKLTKRGGFVYFDINATGLTSGTTYTFSFDVLTDQTKVDTVDRGSNPSIYSPAQKTVVPNVWNRVSRTFTVGVEDTSRYLSIAGWENATVPDGAWMIVDNLLIESGSTVLPYFDGSTPAVGGLTYAWTGTANASWSNQVGVNVYNRTGLSPHTVGWQSTTRSRSGTKSAAFLTKLTTATNVTLWYPAADYVIGSGVGQVPANTKVTWSMYVWVPSGAGNVRLMEASSGTQGNPNTLFDQWERITLSLTTPAGNPFNLRLRSAGTMDPGHTIWIDDELLEASDSALPYFDGSNPDKKNLADNPNLTVNADGWATNDGSQYPAVRSTVSPIRGTASFLSTRTATTLNSVAASIWVNGRNASTTSFKVVPGEVYSFSLDVLTSQNNRRVNTYIAFRNSSGSSIGTAGTAYTNLTANVAQRAGSANVVVPDNADSMLCVANVTTVDGSNVVAGEETRFDGLLIEKSPVIGPYYEGTGDITYAWTGTANASTSTATAPNVAGWATGPSGLFRSTLDPKIGSYSAALMTKGFNGDGLWPGTDMDAIAGRTYTYSAWIKTTSAHGLTAAFRWKDSGFVSLGDTNVSVTSQLTVGSWSLVSATATAPANCVKVQMMLRIYETHTPTTFYIDGAILVESHTPVPYFDGSTAASGDFTYTWVGAANASQSAQLGVGVNELPTTGSAAAISSTEWKGLGTRSLRLIPGLSASMDTFTHLSGDTGGMRVGMVAGKTYTISGTCRLAAPLTGSLGPRSRRLVLFHRSPGEQNYTEVQSTQAPNVAGQARVFLTFTIPTTVTECFIRVYHGGQSGSGDVWWDDILVEESAVLRPYFDGTRPAVENLAKSAATAASALTTHTTDVQFAGSTWTRVTTPAGTALSLTRQYVDVNFLRTGETYTTAVTVANDGTSSVSIGFDWCDVANVSHVIAPGEQKRIVTKGVRPSGYDNTYRFADLHVTQSATESKSILFKDWLIELGDTAGDYYSGTREFTYRWSGTTNTSPSLE